MSLPPRHARDRRIVVNINGGDDTHYITHRGALRPAVETSCQGHLLSGWHEAILELLLTISQILVHVSLRRIEMRASAFTCFCVLRYLIFETKSVQAGYETPSYRLLPPNCDPPDIRQAGVNK